jgi:two-component system, LytTR family, response regulator
MSELRVVLVDDEPLVRRGIRSALDQENGLQIVGEARNGVEAVDIVRAQRPDLVFLDVQMPELDGFGVLAELADAGEPLPAIVFVTAFDEYAIRAFDVHAVDYLLKPFDEERLRLALGRARARLTEHRRGVIDEQLGALVRDVRARDRYLDRLLVKNEGSITVVDTGDIEWIEAADNYVRLHTGRGRMLMRETMKTLEERLDPRRFARIHRSAIVNLSRVRELQPLFSGEYVVLLTTGAKLTLSRGYRDTFRDRLGFGSDAL